MICFFTENFGVKKGKGTRLFEDLKEIIFLVISYRKSLSILKYLKQKISYKNKSSFKTIINKKLTKNYEDIVFNFRVSKC